MALFSCAFVAPCPLLRWACRAAFGLAGFLSRRFANPARPPPIQGGFLTALGWVMANAKSNIIAFPKSNKTGATVRSVSGARIIDLDAMRSRFDPIQRAESELFASFIQAGKAAWYANAVVEYLRLPFDQDGAGRKRQGMTLPQFVESLNCGQAQSRR